MKTSEDLILEVIEDVISEEMKCHLSENYNRVDECKAEFNSLNSFSPLRNKKWELQKHSNRPLTNQYVEDNIKKFIEMKHNLEHEKISKKFFDFESRFTLEKMMNHTNQIIRLLEECQKCTDGM